ncbi:caspase family protein [Streptomyces sp. NPDC088925]|uniref:caspase family protein n=1 Tax=Streptomyces sp. NPDC088925 TaxID=3365914 RepID=UPI00381F2A34
MTGWRVVREGDDGALKNERRRFFVGFGSGLYRHLPEPGQLPAVEDDLASAARLFTGLGYTQVLPGLGGYDSADQIRRKLRHWCDDVRLGPDDILVVYFAGHGAAAGRDRHYLMCWDSEPRDPVGTALATEDLVRILCRDEPRRLLLLLDTCEGGAGAADAARHALRVLAHGQGGDTGEGTGLWFLSSARRADQAGDGVFVSALVDAVADTTRHTGQRQRYLDLTEVVSAVNERFRERRLTQRAELAGGLVTGLAPFFPHTGYHDVLPPEGTDLEMQRRFAAQDLAEHFGPRARGVEFESEQGLYYSGRTAVRDALAAWITSPDGDGRGRVVTGPPGCGKSAVLGRIVALSHDEYRGRLGPGAEESVIPVGCVTASVHARHKRLEEITARIASAVGAPGDGVPSLLQELSRRGRAAGRPVVIVVDAVDEAGSDTAADSGGHGEPRRITRELLRPLSEVPGVRLLIGTRRELVTPLGPTFTCLDLDEPPYRAEESDIAEYVTRVLLAEEEPEIRSPYRGRPEQARTVAAAVAAKAAGVYLYARTTARTLRSDADVLDTGVPGWRESLPSEIGEAFDDYLDRFGPDRSRVRRVLLPLAFSEGTGLPRGQVWSALGAALGGRPCTEDDVGWALDVAGAYVAEVVDRDHRSAHRLYHKALAEHLRATAGRPEVANQAAVVAALRELVREGDWFAAPSYVRHHLATHAAAAGLLGELIADPGFLLAAEPLALLGALASVTRPEERQVRSAYEQVAHRLGADRPLPDRAADLQLSARRCGADALADRIDALALDPAWSARWAWWSQTGAHRMLTGHKAAIKSVCAGMLDGRPVTVTGDHEGEIRVWDLRTQRQIGEPLVLGCTATALAMGEAGDYTLLLTGGADGVVRVWDLSTGREFGEPLRGHSNVVNAIALAEIDGVRLALTGSQDGTARLWRLDERVPLGPPLSDHRQTVHGVAFGRTKDGPAAVTGGSDKRVRVWAVSPDEEEPVRLLRDFGGPARAVTALDVAELDGRDVVLVGDRGGMLALYDLASGLPLGEPASAHVYRANSAVFAATFGNFGNHLLVVSCGFYDARVWDPRGLRQLGAPLLGHVGCVEALAAVDDNDSALAVTVGQDRVARVWDLAADRPDQGHNRQVVDCDVSTLPGGRPVGVTGGEDGTARVWDLRTGNQLGSAFDGGRSALRAVAITWGRSLRRIAAGGWDASVQLWDPADGRLIRVMRGPLGHTNEVGALEFVASSRGMLLVSGGDDGTVRFWDAHDGASLGRPLTGHTGAIRYVRARHAPGGIDLVLATTRVHTYSWHLPDDEPDRARRTGHHDVTRFVSPETHVIGTGFLGGEAVAVLAERSNQVTVHRVKDGRRVAGPFAGHAGWVECARLTEDGETLLTVGRDNRVLTWDVGTGGQRTGPLESAMDLVHERAVSPPAVGEVDGKVIALVASSVDVRLWDLAEAVPRGEPFSGGEWKLHTAAVIHESDEPLVVTVSPTGTVRTHAADTGAPAAPQVPGGSATGFGSAVAAYEGRGLLVRGGWLQTDSWRRGARSWYRASPRRSGTSLRTAILPHHDRMLAVAVDRDFALIIWDAVSGRPLLGPVPAHTAQVGAITGLSTMAGAALAATASDDETVRLWDFGTDPGATPPTFRTLEGHALGADSVALGEPLGRPLLASGSGDGRVRLWDAEALEPFGPSPEPFPSAVTGLEFARVAGVPLLVGGDRYGLVRVGRVGVRGGVDWRAEFDLGATVNAVTADDEGRLYVATDMGLVALRLHVSGWGA